MQKKSIFALLLQVACLLPLSAQARQFANALLTCDQARLEEICWDNAEYVSCRTQLLVFGEHARNYMKNYTMVFANYQNEVILPELRRIPMSNDLKNESTAYQSNGRVQYVKFNLAGPQTLTVESFTTSQPTGGIYEQKNFVGSYHFRNCVK